MEIIKQLSKYCRKRRCAVSSIIIHYISARYTSPQDPYNMEEILRILREYKLSYHEILGRSGALYQLVDAEKTAYHAGVANLFGKMQVNDRSIGIAYVGKSEDHPTETQYQHLAKRCCVHLNKNPAIRPNFILGHDDVAGDWVRGRGKGKKDPGPNFNWNYLYQLIYS